jgi:hypothetical protein
MQASQIPSVPLSDGEHHAQFMLFVPPHDCGRQRRSVCLHYGSIVTGERSDSCLIFPDGLPQELPTLPRDLSFFESTRFCVILYALDYDGKKKG